MNKEEWKQLKESSNYLVSNTGKIKSLNYKRLGIEKELKQTINDRGYPCVFISKNGKYKKILIHQAVAKAFIPNPENKPQVNHIDGDKTNNNVNNLEWCTASENIKQAYKNGLRGKQVGNTYKKRCELAIEYIEKHTENIDRGKYYEDYVETYYLLKIIGGKE